MKKQLITLISLFIFVSTSAFSNTELKSRLFDKETIEPFSSDVVADSAIAPSSDSSCPINRQFILTAGVSFSNFKNGTLPAGAPQGFKVVENSIDPGYLFSIDYIGKKKWGAGFRLSSYSSQFNATQYLGSEELWFLFLPIGVIVYEDYARVYAEGTSFTGYALYRLTSYMKKKNAWEVIFRGGVNYLPITQRMELQAGVFKSSSFIPYSGTNSIEEESVNTWNLFLNASCNLHLGKRFSLMLVDFSQTIPLINPELEGGSLTYKSNTVSLGKHQLNTAGFTYSCGVALHF